MSAIDEAARSVIWKKLQDLASTCKTELNLVSALGKSARFEQLSMQAPHVFIDCSKGLWEQESFSTLLALAEQAGVEQRRDALYAGAAVNDTEQRPALHVQLRSGASLNADQGDVHESRQGLLAMMEMAQAIRAQSRFTDVVHIGIGGSGLGPELVLQALQPWCQGGPRVHVVSNMDGHDLQQTLQGLLPATTLFVVASKSWSTAETQRNMNSAKQWLREADGVGVVHWPDHFVAISSREDLARQDGFVHTLHIPQGVGGRFSIWSAVGLPVALAVGAEVFKRLLAGAAQMDDHFRQAPLARNAPVWLGMLDVWYASFIKMPGRCVAPYHHGLRRLPAYLQQLEMESNGKRVRADGQPVDCMTTGMVWGEAGSNGQHAFFQWLHQGTQRIPVEFIAAREAAHGLPEHQEALLANALAQAQALMQGSRAGAGQLAGHQDFPGNRPSTFMLLDALTPESLGALLALHEHRVFVAGTVWGINSFDQWGVELGKTLAKDLRKRLDSGDMSGLDVSTAGLLSRCTSEVVFQ